MRLFSGDFVWKSPTGEDALRYIDKVLSAFRLTLDDFAGHTIRGDYFAGVKVIPVTIVDGAAAGTFTLPTGALVLGIHSETPVVIPGSPTNTNLRLGSSANGQQYVADVDVKAAGGISLTLVAAARLAASAGTWHYTVASSGGTAASQDGTVNLRVLYMVP